MSFHDSQWPLVSWLVDAPVMEWYGKKGRPWVVGNGWTKGERDEHKQRGKPRQMTPPPRLQDSLAAAALALSLSLARAQTSSLTTALTNVHCTAPTFAVDKCARGQCHQMATRPACGRASTAREVLLLLLLQDDSRRQVNSSSRAATLSTGRLSDKCP